MSFTDRLDKQNEVAKKSASQKLTFTQQIDKGQRSSKTGMTAQETPINNLAYANRVEGQFPQAQMPTTQPTQNLAMLNRVEPEPQKTYIPMPANIGYDIIPRYKEDKPLESVGKNVVNYGLGTAGRLGGSIGQFGMQLVTNIGNAAQGKPLDFSEKSLTKDILPSQVGEGLSKLASKGAGGELAAGFLTGAVEGGLDPGTWVVGGVVDDMSRLGLAGKAKTLGTTENLMSNATRNAKVTGKSAAKTATSQVDKTVQSVNPQRYDILEKMDADDGTYAYIKNKNTGAEKFVKVENKLPKLEAKTHTAAESMGKFETSALPRSKTAATTEPKISEGMKERGFSRNMRTDINNPDELRQSFDEKPLEYKQVANKDTEAKAQAIFERGPSEAISEVYRTINSDKFNPESVPLAKLIARDAVTRGDMNTARTVLSDMAVKLTEAGQFTQAAKILRASDPETFLMTVDKQIRKLNEQGSRLYGKKWSNMDLTPSELDMVRKLPEGNERAFEDAMEQIGNRIAQQMPSTALEKFDAWRRTAMLLNPKTHVRNLSGNAIMMGLRKSADTLAAGLEKMFVKPGQRTKSVGWSMDKNIVNLVENDWKTTAKELNAQGRWDIDNIRALNREKRIFKSNALNRLDTISKKFLNAEDAIFKERAYKDALGGYLKANNLREVTGEARNYATRRALEATYQDANRVASWLSKMKSEGGLTGKLIEAAIPFSKTPTNIVKRAIEYSPAGLLRLLSSKNRTPAQAIEILSQGLTGSATAGLGYLLANMGWLRSEKAASKNAEALMDTAGEQPYSFTTPIGSYTFDWAQPIAVPLFMGVSLYQSLMNQDKIDPDAVAESIGKGGDTIFNLSMLQNVKSLLGGGFGSATEQIMGLPVSYIEQAYPTLFGQIARTADSTRRSTYDTTGAGNFLRQIAAKTPGYNEAAKFIDNKLGTSLQLEPKLDIWGQEQKQGNAFQQFVNPGYAKEASNDSVTQEVMRLYRSTQETDFLPKLMKGSFESQGKKIELTPKQLTEFQRDMGQANYKDISLLINTPKYKNADDSLKARYIKSKIDFNYEEAKRQALEKLK
jgi:hypothetical protein